MTTERIASNRLPGASNAECAELTRMYAQALLALDANDWKLGRETDILIGYEWVKQKKLKWWKPARKIREQVTQHSKVVSINFGLLLTQSGAVYEWTWEGSPSGDVTSGPYRLLDLQTVDRFTNQLLRESFQYIIEQSARPSE